MKINPNVRVEFSMTAEELKKFAENLPYPPLGEIRVSYGVKAVLDTVSSGQPEFQEIHRGHTIALYTNGMRKNRQLYRGMIDGREIPGLGLEKDIILEAAKLWIDAQSLMPAPRRTIPDYTYKGHTITFSVCPWERDLSIGMCRASIDGVPLKESPDLFVTTKYSIGGTEYTYPNSEDVVDLIARGIIDEQAVTEGTE